MTAHSVETEIWRAVIAVKKFECLLCDVQ